MEKQGYKRFQCPNNEKKQNDSLPLVGNIIAVIIITVIHRRRGLDNTRGYILILYAPNNSVRDGHADVVVHVAPVGQPTDINEPRRVYFSF